MKWLDTHFLTYIFPDIAFTYASSSVSFPFSIFCRVLDGIVDEIISSVTQLLLFEAHVLLDVSEKVPPMIFVFRHNKKKRSTTYVLTRAA